MKTLTELIRAVLRPLLTWYLRRRVKAAFPDELIEAMAWQLFA